MDITPAERRELAAAVGCNEQYLYQCLTGRNAMQPADAVRAEQMTGGRLRRWHVRKRDWHLIWPELIGTEAAPAIPEETRDAA
jgi:DNA-binding transcriptional regulator YdaS (Cro superfamily)